MKTYNVIDLYEREFAIIKKNKKLSIHVPIMMREIDMLIYRLNNIKNDMDQYCKDNRNN